MVGRNVARGCCWFQEIYFWYVLSLRMSSGEMTEISGHPNPDVTPKYSLDLSKPN
jgi:hypothetical protein